MRILEKGQVLDSLIFFYWPEVKIVHTSVKIVSVKRSSWAL